MINFEEIQVNEQILRTLSDGKFPVIVKGSFINAYLFPEPLKRLQLSDGADFIATKPVTSQITAFTPLETLLEESQLTDFVSAIETTIAAATGENPTRTHEVIVERDFCTLRLFYQTSQMKIGIDFALNNPYKFVTVPFDCPSATGEPFRLPATVDFTTQSAWKLGQCVYRERGKDFIDMEYLLARVPLKDPQTLRYFLKIAIQDCYELSHSMEIVSNLRSLLMGDATFMSARWQAKASRLRAFAKTFQAYLPWLGEDETGEKSQMELAEQFRRHLETVLVKALQGIDWQPVFSELVQEMNLGQ